MYGDVMKEIYRCANCGHELHHPESSCWTCGYQRKAVSDSDDFYQVFLKSVGDHKNTVGNILVKNAGIPIEAVKETLARLPAIIYEGTNPEKARKITDALNNAGGSAEWGPASGFIMEPIDDAEDYSAESGQTQPSKPPQTFLGKLAPVIIILIMVLPIILRNSSKFKDVIQRLKSELQLESKSDFSTVEVVITSAPIKAGEPISISKLGIMRVPREHAPEGAVAPLMVDLLIGQKCDKDLSPGEIILYIPD